MGNFLAGKVVAVTGAGRGIGRAVALAAAAEGARVVVNDYGVSMDGASPTSEIAEGVVKEILAAGVRPSPSPMTSRRWPVGSGLSMSRCRRSGGSTEWCALPGFFGSGCFSTCPRKSGIPFSPRI